METTALTKPRLLKQNNLWRAHTEFITSPDTLVTGFGATPADACLSLMNRLDTLGLVNRRFYPVCDVVKALISVRLCYPNSLVLFERGDPETYHYWRPALGRHHDVVRTNADVYGKQAALVLLKVAKTAEDHDSGILVSAARNSTYSFRNRHGLTYEQSVFYV